MNEFCRPICEAPAHNNTSHSIKASKPTLKGHALYTRLQASQLVSCHYSVNDASVKCDTAGK